VQNVLVEDNYFANTETAVLVDSVGMGSFGCSWYWPQDVLVRHKDTIQLPKETQYVFSGTSVGAQKCCKTIKPEGTYLWLDNKRGIVFRGNRVVKGEEKPALRVD